MVDFSAANQYEARLFSQVRGGTTGGGNGAISAKFANVYAGIGGAGAKLFDSLSESSIDNTKWDHGIENVQIASGGAQVQLGQSDLGYRVGMDFTSDGSTEGMMAGVLVNSYSHTGGGRVQARLAGTLYNDGSNGSGTAPDTNGANSEVGDVIAIIGMTGTDVSYAVVRCDTALCSQGGVTYIQDYTSLGTVTQGTEHTLAWWWNSSAHTVHFQLDGNASVAFDPTVSNPVNSAAHIAFRQVSDTAGNTKTSSFGSSSSGAITAVFSNVGTF